MHRYIISFIVLFLAFAAYAATPDGKVLCANEATANSILAELNALHGLSPSTPRKIMAGKPKTTFSTVKAVLDDDNIPTGQYMFIVRGYCYHLLNQRAKDSWVANE